MARYNSIYKAVGGVAGVLPVALVWSCSDPPVKPQSPKDYVVYFAQTEPETKLFTFHPTTRRTDSIDIPWSPRGGITVSADGRRLYLNDRTKIIVVDTGTLAPVAELPYPSMNPVAVSPDNQYVAITDDDLFILRTSDYSVVFSDTDQTDNGWFAPDSRTFYCIADYRAYMVNLADSGHPVIRKTIGGVGGVGRLKPSMDQTKWFVYGNGASASAFKVYDVCADSIIFEDVFYYGYGDLAVSPDGRYVYYTHPGRVELDPANVRITIFDVSANQIHKTVTDTAFFAPDGWVWSPSLLAISPDSRWLVIFGSGGFSFFIPCLFDTRTQQLVYRDDGVGLRPLTNPSVQLNR